MMPAYGPWLPLRRWIVDVVYPEIPTLTFDPMMPFCVTVCVPQDDRTAEKRMKVLARRWQTGIYRAPDKNLLKGKAERRSPNCLSLVFPATSSLGA